MSKSFLKNETLEFTDALGAVTTLTSSKITGPPDISFLELTGVSSSDGLQLGLTSDIQSQLYFKNAANTDFGFIRHTPGEISVQSNNLLTVGGGTLRFGNASGAYIWTNTAPTSINQILSVSAINVGQQEYTLDWIDQPSTIPGGSTASIQYNDGASGFAGNGDFLWDTANKRLLAAQLGSVTTPLTGLQTNPFIADFRNTTDDEGTFINVQGTAAAINGLVISDSTSNSPKVFFVNSPTSTVLSTQDSLFLASQSQITLESSGADIVLKNSTGTSYRWPTVDATANQVLSAGSTPGTMEWVTISGGGTPGGTTTNVQFNTAGSFDGTDQFSWDPSNATEPRLLLSKSGTDIAAVAPPLSTGNDFVLDVRNDTGNCWVGVKAGSIGGLLVQDATNTPLGLVYYNNNALLVESTNVLIQSSRLDFNAANTQNGILHTTTASGVINSSDFTFDNTITDPLTTSLIVKNTASTASTIATVTPLTLGQLVCNGTTDSNALLQLESGSAGQGIFVISSGGTDKFTFQHNSSTAVSRIATTDSLNIEATGAVTVNCLNPIIYTGVNGKLLVANTLTTPPTVPSSTLMQLYSSTTARFYLNYSGVSSFGEINISDSQSLGLLISHTRGTQSLIQSQERLRISANNDILLFNGLTDTISMAGGVIRLESSNSNISFINNLQTVRWPTNTPTENSVLTVNNSSDPYTTEWRAPVAPPIIQTLIQSTQLAANGNIYGITSPAFLDTTNGEITLSIATGSTRVDTINIQETGLYKFQAIYSDDYQPLLPGQYNRIQFVNITDGVPFQPSIYAPATFCSSVLTWIEEITSVPKQIQIQRLGTAGPDDRTNTDDVLIVEKIN